MKSCMSQLLFTGAMLSIVLSGCGKTDGPDPVKATWSVEQLSVIEGLDLPESVAIDPVKGDVYVSNIVTPDESYWVDDSNGFISLHKPDGQTATLKWHAHTDDSPVHDPKGMCIHKGKLYFNDNKKVKHISLDGKKTVGVIDIEGATTLNDIATDGENLWVTDTEGSKIYCVSADESVKNIPSPKKVNGVTCYKGKVFAVSWDFHEIYEIDREGKKEPVPFGLEDHFTALDSIEVLDDDSFLVTDFQGNQMCWVSADRKTVVKLAGITTPADVGYDRKNELLYVPLLRENKMLVYKLTKNTDK